jgi:hypothetical protein
MAYRASPRPYSESRFGAGVVRQGRERGQDTRAGSNDQTLRERILPGAVRRRENFLDPHALHAVAKLLAIHLTVAQEIGGRGVVRERGDELLGGPDGGGMLGDVESGRPAGEGGQAR